MLKDHWFNRQNALLLKDSAMSYIVLVIPEKKNMAIIENELSLESGRFKKKKLRQLCLLINYDRKRIDLEI